jgi:predicted secreted protein
MQATTRALALFALAATAAGAAGAQPFAPDPKNRASFAVERSREVPNDRATAIAGTTEEDSDPARLADRINQTMTWALDVAKSAHGIEVRSGGYETHPVYDEKGKIARWGASQDLVLETGDITALSKLLGKLQSRLLLRSIAFSVSPEKRREVEDALIAEALAAFQERAKRVQNGLGARDYELVSLSIQTQGEGRPPMPMYRDKSVMMEQAAAPSFESGRSTLSVRADATIEIEK